MSKSGGFFVFKASGATVSFYPSTETLTVQGTKQEEVSMKLFSLLSWGNSDPDASKQALKEQHVSQEQTDVIQQNHDEHVYHDKQAFPQCPGCKENADAINELKQEFVKLNVF